MENFLWWFIGFSDAEGSFIISQRSTKGAAENTIKLIFQISLHKDDIDVLYKIQNRLQIGVVRQIKNIAYFRVIKQKDILNVLIPIFQQYPLLSTKNMHLHVFSKAAYIMSKKLHLTPQGLSDCLSIKTSMNRGRIDFDTSFNNFHLINPYWLLGFIEGDGSFQTRKEIPHRRRLRSQVSEGVEKMKIC